MTKDEALQMCLEYIETDAHERKYVRHAIKAALEAKDEPVAWYVERQHEGFRDHGLKYGPFWKRNDALEWCDDNHFLKNLYTTPPQQEAKDEPVATKNNDGVTLHLGWDDLPVGTKLYAAPPQRTWVGLTDEVKQEWIDAMPNPPQPRHFMVLVNAIESELKDKNA